MTKSKQLKLVALASAALVASSVSVANAATTVETVDFSQLTGALSMTALLAGITAVAAVKIAPNIAKWGYNKLTSMFGGG